MIDNNTRFLGVDSSKVNLTEKKDALNNAVTQYYTAEEVSGRTYKVYTALLTQEGENAPVATVLENTLGNISFTYLDEGSYQINSEGLFLINKTAVFSSNLGNLNASMFLTLLTFPTNNEDLIFITTLVDPTTYENNVLSNTPIEIRVYN